VIWKKGRDYGWEQGRAGMGLNERNLPPGPDPIVVRPLRPADVTKISELAKQLGSASTETQTRKRLSEMQDSSQFAVYVAAIGAHRIAGWIGAYVFRSVQTAPCVEISGLVVDERLRSKGIGKLLLAAIEEWSQMIGCNIVSVRSNVIRQDAHRFYLNNCYEFVKKQSTFRKTLGNTRDMGLRHEGKK